jgi:hypothetical protein
MSTRLAKTTDPEWRIDETHSDEEEPQLRRRGSSNPKKRRFEDLAPVVELPPKHSDALWTEKYAPQCLEDMIVQDKKVQEFSSIMSNEKVKVLLMAGPPGCGKNSLLDLYCKRHNIELLRYRDEQDSRFVHESLDIARDFQSYPADLENIIHYLRVNAKQGQRTAAAVKASSFAAKKQPLVEKQTAQRRVIVFTGFPLCLKIFNPRRFEFIRDFNEALKQIVFSRDATPLIVFSLSDS